MVLSIVSSLSGFAQSQGISYQAIIINSQVKELPGVDIEGSYLPSTPLTVRFSILNVNGAIDWKFFNLIPYYP